MKAIRLRLYTGDIRPYLRSERLAPTEQGICWRGWVAWESFPQDAGSEPLKLAARTTLEGGTVQTAWVGGSPAAGLKHALQKMVDCMRRAGAGWTIRKPE